MPIVKMPDGTQVRFPDDMPREQIRGMIASKFPDAAKSTAPSPSDLARGNTPMNTLTTGGRAPIGLQQPGNLDLNRRKVFNGPEGDYRTENSMSIGTDNGEVLLPTIVGGQQLSEQDAIDHYFNSGENLGTFKTPEAADQYAQALHLRQEQQYAPKSAQSAPQVPQPTTGAQMAQDLNLPVPGTPMTDQKPAPASSTPWLDPVTAFANNAVDAVPIAGPTLTNMRQNLDAATNSVMTGQPYDFQKSWEQQAGFDADIASAHPEAATAGSVAGAVAPMVALGMTTAGGQALGLTGPTAQRMLAGAASGAAISGADALARGDDMGQAGTKALTGFGLGGAFPLAERVANPFIKMLMGQNVPKAVQAAARNLERDGIDPARMTAKTDAIGPDAMLMDLGPNMTRQAGAIASLPGEGQTTLRNALTARNEGTNARIVSGVDDAIGPAPVPSRVLGGIKENQRSLSPEYEQALEGARAVDTSDLALDLDSMAVNLRGDAQKAVQRVRSMLDVTGNTGYLDPNPGTLLQTRHAIDGMMDGLTDGNTINALTEARKQVDEILTRSVPGIKDVDAKFAELARQRDAFTQGKRSLTGGDGAEHPADIAEQMIAGANPQGTMTGPSAVPFRLTQGTRAQIDNIIGTTANDLQALRRAVGGDKDWNRAKLVAEFGEDKADKLLALVDREIKFRQGFNTVTQNSETAARTAAQKEAAPHQFGSTSTSLADLLLKIPQGMANMGARSRSEAVNKQIADLLTGKPSPELVDQLLAARRMNRGLIGSAPVPMLTNQ